MMLFHSPDYIEFMSKYFYLSNEKRKNPYCKIFEVEEFPGFFDFLL